jgi:hypothetical protein
LPTPSWIALAFRELQSEQLVNLGRENKIVLAEPTNRMRRQLDREISVARDVQIGMMRFNFG